MSLPLRTNVVRPLSVLYLGLLLPSSTYWHPKAGIDKRRYARRLVGLLKTRTHKSAIELTNSERRCNSFSVLAFACAVFLLLREAIVGVAKVGYAGFISAILKKMKTAGSFNLDRKMAFVQY